MNRRRASSGEPANRKRRFRAAIGMATAFCLLVVALKWESLVLRETSGMSSPTRSVIATHTANTYNSTLFASVNSSAAVLREPADDEREQKVLIVTFLFGENTLKKRSIRMFVESARRCGVNIALVGSPAPTFPLPPNVVYVETTWDDLTDRVRDRVFNGQEPGKMRSLKNFYKINDFKPLFAHLYPEVVEGYDWWGYVDSDVVLGNIRKFLTQRILANFDIISPIRDNYTMGPLQLFRNTPVVNELFRLARRPLMELFGTTKCRSFDEYGGNFYGIPVGFNFGYNDYQSSMGGIIEKHHERLGLRWLGGGLAFAWDGFCRGYLQGGICRECHLLKLSESEQMLKQTCFGFYRYCYNRPEVFLCHYQYSKRTMEASLDEETMESLVADGQFRVNFMEGFKPLHTAPRQYLDGTESLLMPPFESSSPRTFPIPKELRTVLQPT